LGLHNYFQNEKTEKEEEKITHKKESWQIKNLSASHGSVTKIYIFHNIYSKIFKISYMIHPIEMGHPIYHI